MPPRDTLAHLGTGSPGEPLDRMEAIESVRLAHWVSQSTRRKPSDPPEWLTG